MEIKPGYKNTEIGTIPEDWKVYKLSDHFRIYAGGDAPKNSVSETRSESYPYPIFANALQNCGLYGFTNEFRAKANSLTITARGFLGHAEYRDEDFYPIVRLLVLEPNGELSPLFTTYAVNDRVKFAFESTGVPQLTAPQVGKYSVAAPSLEEQQTISESLRDVDALLAALDRLITKKRNLKQAAMQQLLTGKIRLPGFTGDWETRRLGEVADIIMGQSPNSSNYNSTGLGLPLIQGNADIHNRETISRIFTTQITKRGRRMDILMSVRAPVGEISRAMFDVCLGRGVCAIRCVGDFMYHCLINHESMWAKHSKGSTFDSVNSADVKKLEIYMPASLLEQNSIAEILTEMDTELRALEQRRDKTNALKQAMMQELLTGKTRLIVPEPANA